MPLLDREALVRMIADNKWEVMRYYYQQPRSLRSLFEWPTLVKTPDEPIPDKMVKVAVYPEVSESYITFVEKKTCVEKAAKICAGLNPHKSLMYGIDSDFSYPIDDTHHLHFVCNEEGRMGGFLPNKNVSQMLEFKLDFDKRVTGRPTNGLVYGPVVVCLLEEEEIEDEDGEYDVVSTALDVTKFALGETLADWCDAWFDYHSKRLYG